MVQRLTAHAALPGKPEFPFPAPRLGHAQPFGARPLPASTGTRAYTVRTQVKKEILKKEKVKS